MMNQGDLLMLEHELSNKLRHRIILIEREKEILIDENKRLREALESIASVGNDHLINLDALLEISQVELAAAIMNDTKLAREALGVK